MKYFTAAAVAVLLTTSAFAQPTPSGQTNPMPSPTQPPGNEGGSPGQRPETTQLQPAQPAPTQSADASNFQTNQGQDQWLVGNLWHKSVYDAAGKSIGDLNDIVMDKDGKITAVVIGVGGFLGLGEKNVAVDFDHLKQHGGISPNRIVLNMSEQDLRNAPSFVRSSSSSNGGNR
jgi:sporulation protein YlmC with PRC-barrel domain